MYEYDIYIYMKFVWSGKIIGNEIQFLRLAEKQKKPSPRENEKKKSAIPNIIVVVVVYMTVVIALTNKPSDRLNLVSTYNTRNRYRIPLHMHVFIYITFTLCALYIIIHK